VPVVVLVRPKSEFFGFDQGDRRVVPSDFVSVIGALLTGAKAAQMNEI
jgi:hypothetical protein